MRTLDLSEFCQTVYLLFSSGGQVISPQPEGGGL